MRYSHLKRWPSFNRRRGIATIVVLAVLSLIPLLTPSDQRNVPASAAQGTDTPVLAISPTEVRLYGVVGETEPPPVRISIEGERDWSAQSNADWLELGQLDDKLIIQADFTDLGKGEHQTTITISPTGDEVPVTATLQLPAARPTVAVAPADLSFNSDDLASDSDGHEITVDAGPDVSWSAVTSAPWLRLSAYSGKDPATVAVSIVSEELPAGEQHGTIWLGSQHVDVTVEGGTVAQEPETTATPEIEATVEPTVQPAHEPTPTSTATTAPSPTPTVTPAPQTLVADPANLRFTVMAGEASVAQQVTIDRSGGAFEPWTASTDTPWLQISEPDLELPATIDVTVDATNLPPGEHASVIYAGDLTIPVSVVVLDPSKARTAIDEVWAFSDYPVREGMVERTWLWGPAPLAETREPYAEAPGGDRLVVYYDKGRLEVTDPARDPSDPTYVTNGLLAKELITGKVQLGDNQYEQRAPADIPVAGDLNDPDSPRYASFTSLIDAAPLPAWSVVTQTLNAAGNVGDNPALARHNVIVTEPDPITNHTVASVFLEYFLSGGGVWVNGGLTWQPYFEDWHTMIGLPITEPFWSQVTANGEEVNILIQCFERRCLTWTPSYEEEWWVEQANVGAAYLQWRYQGQLP